MPGQFTVIIDTLAKLIYTGCMEENTLPKKTMPPIKELINATWILYKKTLLQYIKLALLSWGVLLVLVIVPLGFYFAAAVVGLIGSHAGAVMNVLAIGLLVLYAIALLIFLIFIFSPVISVLIIFILDNGTNLPVKESIRKAFPFILPYIILTVITAVIMYGGFGALIIPGIIFGILFSFAFYPLVLENKKPLEALKYSYMITSQHFWAVLLRLVIVFAGIFLIEIALSMLFGRLNMRFMYYILSPVISWFECVYLFVLYKHLRAISTIDKPVSLRWVWIVAAIGNVILVLFLIYVITLSVSNNRNPQNVPPMQGNYLPSVTPEQKTYDVSPTPQQINESPTPTIYIQLQPESPTRKLR